MSLTIAYITSRKEPKIEWFLDSLMRHLPHECSIEIIIVARYLFGDTGYSDLIMQVRHLESIRDRHDVKIRYSEGKPTIWQGLHRITREDWWAKSNALNTAICLCETETICFVDDRSVLCPSFLYSVEESIAGNYAVCGSYEKRANMVVTDGEIVDMGQLLGSDNRPQAGYPIQTKDWYGGSGALPLEWCLAVNGFSEKLCDGAGAEDSVFGICLRNSGYPIMYDSRMLLIEDRTPGQIDGGLKRADKGISPNDKSHKIIEIIQDKKTSQNDDDIREIRNAVLSGATWPLPSPDRFDWYDGQPIAEME